MAATLENLVVKIGADSKGVKAGTKEAKSSIEGFSKGLKTLAGVIATTFAVKKIFDFAKAGVEAANLQIEAETKLATVLKQRTNATDEQIQSVKDLASAQQELGIIGDEVQIAGAQQLATFVSQSESVETLLPAMNNLIAQQKGYNATSGDAVNIGNLLGKVLGGQVGALSKVGITFSEAQEEVLKYGTESEKAAILAQVITDNVGDMNAELAKTDPGKIKNATNLFGDLKEMVGKGILPVLGSFAKIFSGAIFPVLSDAAGVFLELGDGLSGIVDVIFDAKEAGIDFENTFYRLQETIEEIGPLKNLSEMFGTIADKASEGKGPLEAIFGTIAESVSGFIAELIPQALDAFSQFLPTAIQYITENIPQFVENFLSLRVSVIDTLLGALPELLDAGSQFIIAIVDGVTIIIPMLLDKFIELVPKIVETIVQLLPIVLEAGTKILTSIIDGIIKMLPEIIKVFTELMPTIVKVIADLLPIILEAGIDVLLALIDGIIETLPVIIKTITELIPLIIGIVVDNLPRIIEAGIKILVALIEGITDALPQLIQAIVDLIPVIIDVIIDNLPLILDAGIQILIAIVDGILQSLPLLIDAAIDIISSLNDALGDLLGDVFDSAVDLGKNIVDGILEGVKNLGSDLKDSLVSSASSAVSGVKKFLKIQSPSKVFEEIGGFVSEGFAQGIERKADMVDMAGTGIATQAIESVSDTPSSQSNTNTSSSKLNIDTINIYNQEDWNEANNMLQVLQRDDDRALGFIPIVEVV